MSYIPHDQPINEPPEQLRPTSKPKRDMEVNVKYELDKEAYRQYVADMKDIETEFKNKSNDVHIPANLKEACNRCIEAYPDDDMYHKFIRTHMENILEGKHTDCISCACHDTDDTTEQIPATLKGVCEWWVNTYPEDVFYSAPIQIIEIRKHMKVILDNLK